MCAGYPARTPSAGMKGETAGAVCAGITARTPIAGSTARAQAQAILPELEELLANCAGTARSRLLQAHKKLLSIPDDLAETLEQNCQPVALLR